MRCEVSESKPREWALADGYIPQGLDDLLWSFNDAKFYFQQYESVNPIHVIEYTAYTQALEKIKELEEKLEILRDSHDNHWMDAEFLREKIEKLTKQLEVSREALKQTDQYLCEHIIDPCGYEPEREVKEDLVICVRANSSDADIQLSKLRQALAKLDAIERGE